jgi:hypothetical protein
MTSPFQNSEFNMYRQVHVRFAQTTAASIKFSTDHFRFLTRFIPTVLFIQYIAQYTVTHNI